MLMRKSRFIQHLKSLNPQEWRHFLQFVASPYFNQNKRVTDLVTYLHACAPDFPAEKLKKEAIFPVLFQENEREYSTQAVHDHFSLALRLLQHFFIQKEIGTSHTHDHPKKYRFVVGSYY